MGARGRAIRACAGVAAVLLAGAACGGRIAEEAGERDRAPIDPLAVHLGAIASLSGPDQEIGQRFLLGTQLFVDQINAAGGMRGRRVVLHVEDDRSEPAVTREKLHALAERGVRVAVGPTTSEQAYLLQLEARTHVLDLVSPTATSSALEDGSGSPTPFRVLPSDGRIAVAMSVAAAQRGCERIHLVTEERVTFAATADILRRRATAEGRSVDADVVLPADASPAALAQAAEVVVRSAEGRPSCQLALLGTRTAGPYARAFRAALSLHAVPPSSLPTLAAGLGVLDPEVTLPIPRVSPFEGWWLFAPVSPARPSAPSLAFSSAFRTRHPGVSSDIVTAVAYDAAALAALAAADAAGRPPEATLRSAGRPGRVRVGADDLRGFVGHEELSYEGASGVVDVAGGTEGEVGAAEIDAIGEATERLRFSGRDLGGPPYAP